MSRPGEAAEHARVGAGLGAVGRGRRTRRSQRNETGRGAMRLLEPRMNANGRECSMPAGR